MSEWGGDPRKKKKSLNMKIIADIGSEKKGKTNKQNKSNNIHTHIHMYVDNYH